MKKLIFVIILLFHSISFAQTYAVERVIDGDALKTEDNESETEFLLLLGGKLSRNKNGYQLNETFVAQVLDIKQKILMKQFSQIQQEEAIYKIETVYKDKRQEEAFSTISYCPPHTDVCETLSDRQPPLDSLSHWSPTPIVIKPGIVRINFYISDLVVKSIVKPESSPRIVQFINLPLEDGYKISWKIENGNSKTVGLTLDYLSSPNIWQVAGFGDAGAFTSFIANSNSIQTTLEDLDFRLVATDGFHIDVYHEKNFIPSPRVKELTLHLSGAPIDERIVGQDMFLKLMFIDPQTGVGCNGNGCKSGANQGRYEIMWFSERQNICSTDVYNGELQYRFKKTGAHKVGVRVQHREKEYLKGEVSVQVSVRLSPFPVEDNTDPNCSF